MSRWWCHLLRKNGREDADVSFWYQGRESKLVFGHINYEMPFRDAWPSRDAKQGGVGSIS